MEIKRVKNTNCDFLSLCRCLDKVHNELVAEQRCKGANCCVGNEIYTNVYIMYDNNNPVGFLACTDCIKSVVEIGRVFVSEKYRNQGVATKLFENAEKVAKEQGAKSLILDTYERLVDAIRLYKKLGFKIVPQFHELKDSPFSICMSKEIF